MESTTKVDDKITIQQADEVNDTLEDLNLNTKKEKHKKKEKEEEALNRDKVETVQPSTSTNLPTVIIQCEKDEYLVKTINWKGKKIRIITQNENGPCPLVAICNVLFLRGDLDIQPPDREAVTFEYLVDRLGDYLLTHGPVEEQPPSTPSTPLKLEKRQATSEFVLTYRHNLDTALSILPNLKSGLDVNVKFESIHGFEPTAELAMFDLFNVDLVHGWIADPQDMETFDVIVKKCVTYNHLVECIVQADELSTRHTSNGEQMNLTLDNEEKLHQGFIATEFLKDTATQLTYYGLDLLLDSIPVDTLCVLFRNNHFSTVYRHSESGLYMLVTDSGLVSERSIVWESLSDVDQSSSEFFNGQFKKPTLKENNIAIPPENGIQENTDLDYAIAVSMQQDEQNRQQQQQQRNSYHSNHINNNSSPVPNTTTTTQQPKPTNNNNNNTKLSKNNKCIIS